MIPRHGWPAVVLLALVAPMLAFPQWLGPSHAWQAAAICIGALCVATVLLADFGRLGVFAGVLSLAAIVGWWQSPNQWASLNHFCGLALGLLAMGTVAVWCRTRQTLAIGTLAFVLFGCVALTVGFRSVTPVADKVMIEPVAFGPVRPLPLPALHSRTDVNPNALAATAMLILPVAGALVLAPVRFAPLGSALRAAGFLTTLWAAILVLLMQSRSAWLAAAFILWLLARRWTGAKAWWLAAGLMFVVLPAAVVFFGQTYPQVALAVRSLSVHTEIWMDALQALRISPWLGIGFDYYRHIGVAPHAHNIVLQTILDIGLVGLAGYLAVIGFVMRCALDLTTRRHGDEWVRYVGTGAALSIVSVHIFGLLDAVPLGAKVGIFQWWSCGLILAALRLTDGAPKERVVERHRIGNEPAGSEPLTD